MMFFIVVMHFLAKLFKSITLVAKGEAMLDPLKITVKTPGIDVANAKYENTGIPIFDHFSPGATINTPGG